MKLFKRIGLFLLIDMLFFYVGLSLFKGTSATSDVPPNEAFDDMKFYKCVVDAYNEENDENVSYTTSLSDEQLKTITSLPCSMLQIKSAKGIEKLQLLESLYLGYNQLSSLDISQNTALLTLNVSNNQLTSLDVSKNIKLLKLYAFSNKLTKLDVSQNVLLTHLGLENNQLSELDVSSNTLLEYVYAYNNQLTEIDLSKNKKLTELKLSNNQLTSLDISKNVLLDSDALSISGNPYSETIYVYKNSNVVIENLVQYLVI